jgi:hypothetical protein
LHQKDAPLPAEHITNGTGPADEDFVFREITGEVPLSYRHAENEFADFQREPLLPHKISREGPRIAIGDVNGDGLEDLYLGAAKGFAGEVHIQTKSGTFMASSSEVFQGAKISEDIGAAFFDADGDGDLDLYVVSGGNEYAMQAPALLDRLYLNDGRGNFSHSANALPKFYASGSCVEPEDFDNDGDTDLFIGSRSVPWGYGLTPTSYLLQNNGSGEFSIVTDHVAPELATAGMVTDAQWRDWDKDGDPDLIVVGEWMPVTLFENTEGKLENINERVGLQGTEGWWNRVAVDDLNEDGYDDLVCGNLGLNSKIQASPSQPASIYVYDFNNDGLAEQMLCHYRLDKSYPMVLRSDLVDAIPYLKYRFPGHADYADKQITEIFTEAELSKAVVKHAYSFATSVFYGQPDGRFRQEALPAEAQFSPVYAILAGDFDDDDTKDLLLAGNFYGVTPQLGRYDASYGVLLKGGKMSESVNGQGAESYTFTSVPLRRSGLVLTGQVREVVSVLFGNGKKMFVFAKNDEPIQVYEITNR